MGVSLSGSRPLQSSLVSRAGALAGPDGTTACAGGPVPGSLSRVMWRPLSACLGLSDRASLDMFFSEIESRAPS
ncbi:hypothetical protein [Actinomyces sp. oral taxon 170]|uniref:hypothetical protein n=1 Tax=Actinomyces sp. oral taxon 170 TaxID=712117 RepID=UPI000302C23D|nr:hypothetical protein [Actinomyces sp. oral taxon 170]